MLPATPCPLSARRRFRVSEALTPGEAVPGRTGRAGRVLTANALSVSAKPGGRCLVILGVDFCTQGRDASA